MARPSTGSVVADTRDKDGKVRYGIRFSAYGKRRYVALGEVTRQEAQGRAREGARSRQAGNMAAREAGANT